MNKENHKIYDDCGISCSCGHCHGEDARLDNVLTKSGVKGFFCLYGIELAKIVISSILLCLLAFLKINGIVKLILAIIALGICGYQLLINCFKNIFHGVIFDENALMLIASVTAMCLGDYMESVLIIVLFSIGELLEHVATNNSRKRIAGLSKLKVTKVNLISREGLVSVSPENVPVGSLIEVKKGECVPIDGEVVGGTCEFDTKAVTGESAFYSASRGDKVFSGSINVGDAVVMRTLKLYKDSTVEKIISLVEGANANKAKSQRFITKFSKFYTPIIVCCALVLAFLPPLFDGYNFAKWIYKSLSFLVISCPCALVISVPLTFFIGVGKLAQKGILVKGSVHIDSLCKIDTVVFDKTGTVTKGNFSIENIECYDDFDKNTLIKYAKSLEILSTHPIGEAIIGYGAKEVYTVTDFAEISGKGLTGNIENKKVAVGNKKLLNDFCVAIIDEEYYGSIIYVCVEGCLKGKIYIADTVKENAKHTIEVLNKLKVTETAILSGDRDVVCQKVGDQLGIKNIYSELLPNEKADKLQKLLNNKRKVMYVGDGINDSPCIALSDVGVAMGALGSGVAIECADVVIMDDNLSKVPVLIKKSRAIKRKVLMNIVGSLSVKLAIMVLSILLPLPVWVSMLADVGVMLLAVGNALLQK